MKCLQSGDSFELVSIERGLSVKKCLSYPLLLNQKNKEKELIKIIFLIVKRFNDLVNVSKKMNEDQMIALSADLLDHFGGESLEDIMLFFKMARSGDFGDFYRLDSIVVLSWIRKYLELKIIAREDEIQNERNIRQRLENDAVENHVPDEKSKENLELLAKKLKTAGRKTDDSRSDNPLFNYDTYVQSLQESVKTMGGKELKTMLENTSKIQHRKVYEILEAEFNERLDKMIEDPEKGKKKMIKVSQENENLIKMYIQVKLQFEDVFAFLTGKGYEVKSWLWRYDDETFPGGLTSHESWTFTATLPGEEQKEENMYLRVFEKEIKSLLKIV